MSDEEIQEMMDGASGDRHQSNEYSELFKMLDNPKHFELKPGFAHRITSKILHREESDKKLYVWLAAGIFILCVFLFGTLIFTKSMSSFGYLFEGFNIYAIFFMMLILVGLYQLMSFKLSEKKSG